MMDSSSSSIETDTDSEYDIIDPPERATPSKRRCSSRRHGLNWRRAKYYKSNSFSQINRNRADNVALSSTSSTDESSDDLSGITGAPSPVSSTGTCTDTLSSSSNCSSDSEVSEDIQFTEPEHREDQQGTQDYYTPLYEGCAHSKISLYTAMILLVTKHSLSSVAFSDMLLLILSILPKSSGIATSVYKVKEIMKTCTKFQDPKIHYYCEKCQIELKSASERCSCSNEREEVLQYHNLNMEQQIKDLFADKRFCSLVMKDRDYAELGVWKDICDGEEYKKLVPDPMREDRNIVHLTFTMNTDGVAVFKSSKKGNLWPVYMAINELPVRLRFSKKYIMSCYLYCQVEKPNMLTYLSNFIKTLRTFHDEGMEVMTSFGKRIVKGHLLIACLDLPARALVANMKQFNGKFGCSICFDPGQTRAATPMHRYYPFLERNELRTHLSMIEDMRKAATCGEAERGLKGASALVKLKYVDFPKVFPVDWMHCVLLGVTKALLNLWLGRPSRNEDFYIGDKIALLDKRLMQIKVPDFVARQQRSLQECKHWKATECREWLLHFSVPVVSGVLPSKAFAHYCLLVSGVALLNKEVVTLDEVNYAEELLLDFCRIFPDIYSEIKQTMNIHLLRHLPQFVRLYGPLFNFSCFGFESLNAHLKSMIHGSRHVNSQIAFAMGMTKSLPNFVKDLVETSADENVIKLFKHLSCKFTREEQSTQRQPVSMIGKPTQAGADYNHLLHPVLEEMHLSREDAREYLRLSTGGSTLTCIRYKKGKARSNSTVSFEKGQETCFGQVMSFILCGDQPFAVVKQFKKSGPVVTLGNAVRHPILQKYAERALCSHIHKVIPSEEVLVGVGSIHKKCVLMEMEKDIYISEPPNLLEHD